jgi:hypothetical protein
MEKEFVNYNQALKLKELGFDEPCFGRYYCKKSYSMLNPNSEETELVFEFGQYIKQTEITILAPLFQQAFRWFREKGYLSYIEVFNDGKYDYTNVSSYFSEEVDYNDGPFDTYEEAELTCLKKLIEIVEIKE